MAENLTCPVPRHLRVPRLAGNSCHKHQTALEERYLIASFLITRQNLPVTLGEENRSSGTAHKGCRPTFSLCLCCFVSCHSCLPWCEEPYYSKSSMVWWVNFGWPAAAHQAVLSLPLLSRTGGEKLTGWGQEVEITHQLLS